MAEKTGCTPRGIYGFKPWFFEFKSKYCFFARNFLAFKIVWGGFKIKSEKRERWFRLVVFVMALKSMGAKNDNLLEA